MRAKRYFCKWDVERHIVVLDSAMDKRNPAEFLICREKITAMMGRKLQKAISEFSVKENRQCYFSEVEFLFYSLFSRCKQCSSISLRANTRKQWGELCEACFRDKQKADNRNRKSRADRTRQLRLYKLHLSTLQGQIDAVPMDIIRSNIGIELKLQNRSWSSIAEDMEITPSKLQSYIKRKHIKKEVLLLICESLKTPVKRLLRVPKGYKIAKIEGVPKFWFDTDYRISKTADWIPRHG